MPRGSGATCRVSRPTRGCSWSGWSGRTSIRFPRFRRRSRCARRTPSRMRARRSAPSPKSATTCGCCSRRSGAPSARNAAAKSAATASRAPARDARRAGDLPLPRAVRDGIAIDSRRRGLSHSERLPSPVRERRDAETAEFAARAIAAEAQNGGRTADRQYTDGRRRSHFGERRRRNRTRARGAREGILSRAGTRARRPRRAR